MKNKQLKLSVNLLLWFGLTALPAQSAQVFSDLKGDYLGQPLPGETPVVFARGIVSTDDKEHSAPGFSPDGNEVFWWTIRQESEDKWLQFSKTMRRVGNRWAALEILPDDNMPTLSPDGKRLYYGSKKEGEDLYYVEKQSNGWSAPKSAGLVTRFPDVRFAYYPSIASNGTLYFMGYLLFFAVAINCRGLQYSGMERQETGWRLMRLNFFRSGVSRGLSVFWSNGETIDPEIRKLMKRGHDRYV